MKKGLNKKGQNLTIGAIVLIVLGIIVLVLLILGFSLGWGNLWERIKIYGGGGSTIGDVITNCKLAATSDNTFSYCQDFKEINVAGQKEYVNCQDSRVENNLDTTLNCGTAPNNQKSFTAWFCDEKLKSGAKPITKTVKVNGENCNPVQGPPAP